MQSDCSILKVSPPMAATNDSYSGVRRGFGRSATLSLRKGLDTNGHENVVRFIGRGHLWDTQVPPDRKNIVGSVQADTFGNGKVDEILLQCG